MRATEIIRDLLDLIDQIECNTSEPEPEMGIFAQIITSLSQQTPDYDNSPAPHTQGIDSVTTNAGGGWNGPKNPADLRSDSVSMYPNYQHKPE